MYVLFYFLTLSLHPSPYLATFIFWDQRVIKSPAIKAKFRFSGSMPSGRIEAAYNEELSRHVLTRFLSLVIFLDRAKVTETLFGGGKVVTEAFVVSPLWQR